MITFRTIVSSFVDELGQARVQPLGGTTREPQPEQVRRFSGRLKRQSDRNSYLMAAAVAVLCLLFVVCVFLVVYYRHSPKTTMLVFGGNILQLIVIVAWLRRLWLDKNTMEALLIVADELPPLEAAKIITNFYFKVLTTKVPVAPSVASANGT